MFENELLDESIEEGEIVSALHSISSLGDSLIEDELNQIENTEPKITENYRRTSQTLFDWFITFANDYR